MRPITTAQALERTAQIGDNERVVHPPARMRLPALETARRPPRPPEALTARASRTGIGAATVAGAEPMRPTMRPRDEPGRFQPWSPLRLRLVAILGPCLAVGWDSRPAPSMAAEPGAPPSRKVDFN